MNENQDKKFIENINKLRANDNSLTELDLRSKKSAILELKRLLRLRRIKV